MKIVTKYFRRYRMVIALIVLFIYAGSTMCKNVIDKKYNKVAEVYGANENYIGSPSCNSCHKEIYDGYLATAHYNTSAVMGNSKIIKRYSYSDTVFYTSKLFINVHQQGDTIYQTAYSNGRMAAAHPMNIVFGSGKKGQTFLFWNESSLYQLPLSYSFVHNQWINSPGYPADKVMFNRVIPVKCFECHATYADEKINDNGKPVFDSSRLVLGISCETCHGPGKNHIEYHKKNPADKNARFIINTAKLSRQQELDACANCHSGIRENIKPAFSFLPGDKLDDFFKPGYNKDSTSVLDVHGNQYGLLTASKCFKQSLTLNCSSCHNAHVKETNQLQVYAQRCMNCHNESSNSFCTVKNVEKHVLMSKCIDCHMPMQASNQITFNEGNKKAVVNESIRTHLIRIYKDNGGTVFK